ncbi:hypothetical protein [Butyrivibrio sp. WCD3002]|uniref:hypothetical protein n=1 Tax=Butyrivibrio sp. WCD3002 TaxID=1280676 RepID=UPI0003FC7FD7|nr:hypothetical protein [Butyrivibrio sp. WCD3002]
MPKKSLKNDKNGISLFNYTIAVRSDYFRRLRYVDIFSDGNQVPKMPDDLEIAIDYIAMTDEELKAEYDKLLADNPSLWEYSSGVDDQPKGAMSLPRHIRNTGDKDVLTEYLKENEDKLNYEQQYLINRRIKATDKKLQSQAEKAQQMEQEADLYILPEVHTEMRLDGDEAIELTGVHQESKQSSGNGCWSVFLANAAGSRGVDITQEDIRSYRPELKPEAGTKADVFTDDAYNTDSINNALEMGDGVLAYMPGQMLSELEIAKYSDIHKNNGITRRQFEEKAITQLKTTIKHALKEDKSPVGLLEAGHYLTIVGIDGDIIKYKDSAGVDPDPDHTYEGSLTTIATSVLNDPEISGIQLTWMKDVQLSKDGRTIFGVPSDYVRMSPDGTVQGQPDPIRLGGGMPEEGLQIQSVGVAVSRYAGTEDTKPEQNYRPVLTDGIIKTEKVYLPKKLNATYLNQKAANRSNEEERRLREVDNNYYNMNRPLEPVMADPGVPDYAPAMEQAMQRYENEINESWKHSIENGIEFIKNGASVEFDDLSFMTTDNLDITKISDEERQIATNVCEDIFGTDKRETSVFDSDSVLKKFTYKKTPDGETVNLWDDVESQLRKNPEFAGSNNEVIRSFIRPVILREMMNKDSALTFENGEGSVRNIFVNKSEQEVFPDINSVLKEDEFVDNTINLPNAYYEEIINPFGKNDLFYDEEEIDDELPEAEAEGKDAENKQIVNDNADNKEPQNNSVENKQNVNSNDNNTDANNVDDKKTDNIVNINEMAEKEIYKVSDIEDYDPDVILKSFDDAGTGAADGSEFPETNHEAQGEMDAFADSLPVSEDMRQPNPFDGVNPEDEATSPYSKDAWAEQINPFEDYSENVAGAMYAEASKVNDDVKFFRDPEREETYAAQRNTAEKIWFTEFYLAKGKAIEDTHGIYTPYELQKKSDLIADAIVDINSFEEALDAFVAIEAKANIAIGKEAARKQQQLEQRVRINTDKKQAADYLVKDGSSKEIQLGRAKNEMEELMRQRFLELQGAEVDPFGNIDFDSELNYARERYRKDYLKAADEGDYERGRLINDADEIERPEGILPPVKHGRNIDEYDRVLHAKKPVEVDDIDTMEDIFDKGAKAEMPTNFVNTYYQELDSLRKLTPATEKVKKTIKSSKTFYRAHKHDLDTVEDLVSNLSGYYTKSETGNTYPQLGNAELLELRSEYMRNINRIKNLRDNYRDYKNHKYESKGSRKRVTENDLKSFNDALKLLTDDLQVIDKAFKAKEKTSLPLAAFKHSKELEKINYVNGVFKHPGLVEYSRIFVRDNKTPEEIRKRFEESTPGQILTEYQTALATKTWLYEYLPKDNKIPANIENTSDIEQIEKYMKRNSLLLTDQEKAHLQAHINSAIRAENINDIAENNFNNLEDYYKVGKPTVIVTGEEGAELDIHQEGFQSSGNGCWSVAGAMMVNSRGGQRLVKQEDIRNYRPKLAEGEVFDKNGMLDSAYNEDRGKNIMDMGDSILEYAPNTMLRQLDIAPYSDIAEKKGISPDEYIENATNAIKKQLLYSIKVDRSPVAFLNGSHYITITGIDGNIIKYKDSSENKAKRLGVNADHTYVMSIDELIGDKLTGPAAKCAPLQFTWMSDIKLNKDLKQIHGVPSKYATVATDGTVYPAPDAIQAFSDAENTVANRNGVRFCRLGGDEENNKSGARNEDIIGSDGILKVEKAYLPKKLNMMYLMHEAERRPHEEDERLNNNDKEMLGIDRGIPYNPEEVIDLPEVPTNDLGQDGPSAGTGDFGASGKDGKAQGGQDHEGSNGDADYGDEMSEDKKLQMVRDINKVATQLSEKMDKSTPWYINSFTDALWITDTSVDFDDLKDGLNSLKSLSADALKDGGKNITDQKLNEMMEVMNASITSSKEYLNYKSDQFKEDGTRKNGKSKSGTEQARIKAVVESYDELTKLSTSITAVVKKQSKDYLKIQKKKAADNTKDYTDLLVSTNSVEINKLQADSYKDRAEIPEHYKRRLVRLEAIYSKKPEFLEEFHNRHVIKYKEVQKGDKTEKVSIFTELKEIKDEFKPIGPASKNAKLSDKDFAAIAMAESTTKEVFKAELDKLKKNKTFDGISEEVMINNYASHTYNCICAEVLYKLTDIIPFAEKARQKAVKDLKAYEAGDKKPLATVLANSLNFMTAKWKAELTATNGTEGEFAINSEMGQRMYKMLERDPELMDLARQAGLKSETYFNLKAMEKHGRTIINGDNMRNELLQAKEKELLKDKQWKDKDVKDDRYADLILTEALRQEKFKAEARKDNLVSEIKKHNDAMDKEFCEKRRIATARQLIGVIRAYKDKADFKDIADRFYREYRAEGFTDKDTVDNNEKLVDLLDKYNAEIFTYKDNKYRSMEDLERELIAYYHDEIHAIKIRRRLEDGPSFGDEASLEYAVAETKKYLNKCEKKMKEGIKLTSEEDDKYRYLKDITDRYAELGADNRKLGEFERQKLDETGHIKLRQLLIANDLYLKNVDQNEIAEQFNIVDQHEDLKERFKVFMRYKGLDQLSPKEFARAINTNSKLIGSNLFGDLIQFERDLKAGKIKLNEQPVINKEADKQVENAGKGKNKAENVNEANKVTEAQGVKEVEDMKIGEVKKVTVDDILKVKIGEDAKPGADASKITANDILNVEISSEKKPAAGADNEKVHKITADDILDVKIGVDEPKKAKNKKIAIMEGSGNSHSTGKKKNTIIMN